jgi:hypothetical protein
VEYGNSAIMSSDLIKNTFPELSRLGEMSEKELISAMEHFQAEMAGNEGYRDYCYRVTGIGI